MSLLKYVCIFLLNFLSVRSNVSTIYCQSARGYYTDISNHKIPKHPTTIIDVKHFTNRIKLKKLQKQHQLNKSVLYPGADKVIQQRQLKMQEAIETEDMVFLRKVT